MCPEERADKKYILVPQIQKTQGKKRNKPLFHNSENIIQVKRKSL